MRIVVNGASGFLGRALMRQLAGNGIDVVGVSRRAVPGLVQVAGYADAPQGDVLIHLAEVNDRSVAESSGTVYAKEALATLESLLCKGFERVIYSSSAVLYGDQHEAPRTVQDPVHIVDTYTELKYASEQAVLGNNGVVARLTNLYGPGMAEGNVLSTILKQLPLNGPIRVRDATPVRDFLWIEDAAAALSSMARGSASGIFNVGSGQGSSILDLANSALNAAGQTGRPVESEYQGPGRSRLVVDITQTLADFAWQPSTSLPQGIEKFIKIISNKE